MYKTVIRVLIAAFSCSVCEWLNCCEICKADLREFLQKKPLILKLGSVVKLKGKCHCLTFIIFRAR